MHKFSFLCRTIPNIKNQLQPLENCIRLHLIPALTGRTPSDVERSLLGLPLRLGGMGLTNPTTTSTQEYTASKSISLPLCELIREQLLEYPFDCVENREEDCSTGARQQQQGLCAIHRRRCPSSATESHGLGTGERSLKLAHVTSTKGVKPLPA